MPYTDEQWEYFKKWENYNEEKDKEYSLGQFNFILERIKNNNPLSVVRFGEGESRIVLKEQTLNRTELSYNPSIEKNNNYVVDLENVAKINHKNYFVGIQSYTYRPGEKDRPLDEFIKQREFVMELGNLPKTQYTCSRVFCNNYKLCNTVLLDAIKDREIYFVSSAGSSPSKLLHKHNFKKHWGIHSKDAWKTNQSMYEEIKNELINKKDCVLICCAGFFGNILISKLNHDNNFYLNVGSVYDPTILGKTTRGYHRK